MLECNEVHSDNACFILRYKIIAQSNMPYFILIWLPITLLQLGEVWVSSDCLTQYNCTVDGVIATDLPPCPENSHCEHVFGEYDCVCDDGYEENGDHCDRK